MYCESRRSLNVAPLPLGFVTSYETRSVGSFGSSVTFRVTSSVTVGPPCVSTGIVMSPDAVLPGLTLLGNPESSEPLVSASTCGPVPSRNPNVSRYSVPTSLPPDLVKTQSSPCTLVPDPSSPTVTSSVPLSMSTSYGPSGSVGSSPPFELAADAAFDAAAMPAAPAPAAAAPFRSADRRSLESSASLDADSVSTAASTSVISATSSSSSPPSAGTAPSRASGHSDA